MVQFDECQPCVFQCLGSTSRIWNPHLQNDFSSPMPLWFKATPDWNRERVNLLLDHGNGLLTIRWAVSNLASSNPAFLSLSTLFSLQGIHFSEESGKNGRIYLLGNPVIWVSNLVLLVVFALLLLWDSVKTQRGQMHATPTSAGKSDFFKMFKWYYFHFCHFSVKICLFFFNV